MWVSMLTYVSKCKSLDKNKDLFYCLFYKGRCFWAAIVRISYITKAGFYMIL